MPLPFNLPPKVIFLYQMHERARRSMGQSPSPFLTWAAERVGIKGYEEVTLWAQQRCPRP